jgi:GNAT superfamily N-acetyltransferase
MHEQNPYTNHPFIYLVIIDGKAVGMRAFYGARYEVVGSGETFDAVCGAMFVTDKSVRGQGFATVIMEGALKDIAASGYRYVFSYSAGPITYMSQRRRGWRLITDYRTILRPEKKPGAGGLRSAVARRFPLLRKLWRGTGRRVLGPRSSAFAPLDALTTSDPPSELRGGTLSISRKADAPAMAELAKATALGLIRHVRDPAYFAWRYESPRMEYRFIYWRDTKLRGFLALQTSRGGAYYVRIVDWEAENEQVLKGLFRVALESGKFASLTIWSAALTEEMVSFLSNSGFAQIDGSEGVVDYRPGLLIKSLDDDPTGDQTGDKWEVSGRRIEDLANWDLRPIYSD